MTFDKDFKVTDKKKEKGDDDRSVDRGCLPFYGPPGLWGHAPAEIPSNADGCLP